MKSKGFIVDCEFSDLTDADPSRTDLHIEDTAGGPTIDDTDWIATIWIDGLERYLHFTKPEIERFIEALQEVNARYTYSTTAEARSEV